MDKYVKWIGIGIACVTLIGNYYVLHYRVNLVESIVENSQDTLGLLATDVAVIKAKME